MSQRLETLDQSRSEFVSNASHELKTPLATMKILIESLIYQPEMQADLRTEFLTDINAEINRLTAIVSDLLTLVQVDAHSMRLDREKMSLAAIVKETSHRLEPMAAKRGQSISLSLDDSGDMYADKSKLRQVIYNLLDNAIKYTQDGGKIGISVTRLGRDIVLTVSDDGPGVKPEHLPHVFDRFYRIDKARSRDSGGTGLGLSIVRQIVLLHGGSIRAVSEEGKGSSFIVELPIHRG
jgi:signal transduction histidine kinase